MDSLPIFAAYYIIGYGLLFLLANRVTNSFYKEQNGILKLMATLLHIAFVLLSLPIFFVVAYLFTNLKNETGGIFYGIIALVIALCSAHLWLVIKSTKSCIKLLSKAH
jgi:ABC-type multidrug transport system permease subunit